MSCHRRCRERRCSPSERAALGGRARLCRRFLNSGCAFCRGLAEVGVRRIRSRGGGWGGGRPGGLCINRWLYSSRRGLDGSWSIWWRFSFGPFRARRRGLEFECARISELCCCRRRSRLLLCRRCCWSRCRFGWRSSHLCMRRCLLCCWSWLRSGRILQHRPFLFGFIFVLVLFYFFFWLNWWCWCWIIIINILNNNNNIRLVNYYYYYSSYLFI